MKIFFKYNLVIFVVSMFCGCSMGSVEVVDPNSPNAKVVVKSQLNFIRNITLNIESVDGRNVSSFMGTSEAILSSGEHQIEISVSDTAQGIGVPQSSKVFIDAKPGHTYIISPSVVSGAVFLRLDDNFNGISSSRVIY